MSPKHSNKEKQFLKDCEDLRLDIEELNDILKEAGLMIRWDKILKPMYHGKTIH